MQKDKRIGGRQVFMEPCDCCVLLKLKGKFCKI